MMFEVRLMVVCWLVVLANSAIRLPKRSNDQVAEICSPICETETDKEMDCALSRTCFDINDQVSDTFQECMRPCWKFTKPCFSLCAESYDLILNQCFNICKSTIEDHSCIGTCYHLMFFDLKNDLFQGLNDTLYNGSTTTTTQDDIETPSTISESSSVDSSSTPTPRSTTIILAALEINQILEENLTDEVSDFENTLKADGKLNSFELPGLNEKVDNINANATEHTIVKEGVSLLSVLKRHLTQRSYPEFELSQVSVSEPTNDTEIYEWDQQYVTYVNQFDENVLKNLLESYDRPISDYLKSKYFGIENFSELSSRNSSQSFGEDTEESVQKNSTNEVTTVRGSNKFMDSRINLKMVQGSKRLEDRHIYVEMLKKANLKFLQLEGLTGPLSKDKTMETYFEISRRKAGVDLNSPILIG